MALIKRSSATRRRSYRRSVKRSKCRGLKPIACNAVDKCKTVKRGRRSYCRKVKNRHHRRSVRKH